MIHAGRSGAEENNMTAGEESLDDVEAGVSGQCGRCGTCGRECLGDNVEERQHVGRGKAQKLRRTKESVSGGIVNSRDMSNILS